MEKETTVEEDFAMLSEKYLLLSDKYEELVKSYLKEKELNDTLILDMEKITKNTSNLSTEFIKTSQAFIELQKKTEHGIFLEYENERIFLPIMSELQSYIEREAPKRIQYTFMPTDIKQWFEKVEMLTKNDYEKIVYVKKNQ